MAGLLLNSQPGSPSAITQMLGLLMQQPPAGQPGQPPPAPAAPMPPPNVAMQMPDPQQQQAQPQQSLLGKIHDFISDRVGIKQPGGYQGLLSSEEIQQAKPGILAAGAGDSWSNNLNRILQMHEIASGVAEHQRIMKARADMPQNLDLPGMLKYATQHGDMEMIKTLGGPLEGMLSSKGDTAPHTLPTAQGIMQWNPATKKFEPTGMQPVDRPANYSATPGVDPVTGKPTVYTLNTHTGKMTSSGVEKPVTDNPQMQLVSGRAQAGIAEMNNADAGLRLFETKMKNGTANYTGLQQFMGRLGDTFVSEEPKDLAAQTAALVELNKVNPELARYIRRGLSFAEGESLISQRPSDYRTKLAAFLSTATSGASNEMIDDIQSRRGTITKTLNATKLGQLAAAAVGGAKPVLTQAGYNNGIARGHTRAELALHYDLSKIK